MTLCRLAADVGVSLTLEPWNSCYFGSGQIAGQRCKVIESTDNWNYERCLIHLGSLKIQVDFQEDFGQDYSSDSSTQRLSFTTQR